VIETFSRAEIELRSSWRLNERHYGALQGRTRDSVRAELGAEEFMRIRRSLLGRPPERDVTIGGSCPSGAVDRSHTEEPLSESLDDVRARLLPYWLGNVLPDLAAGKTVLIAAHGNTIRVLRWQLEGLSEPEVATLRVPLGNPLLYCFDNNPASWDASATFLGPRPLGSRRASEPRDRGVCGPVPIERRSRNQRPRRG